MAELAEVKITLDVAMLTAVQQGLNLLAVHANTTLSAIQEQVRLQLLAADEQQAPVKANGHAIAE